MQTRERILAAAAATLRARGYSQTRLAEIGERAQVRAPAIYHYFRSREALLAAVLSEGHRIVREHTDATLADLPTDAGPRARLARLTDTHLRVQLERSDFATAVTRTAGQVPPSLQEELAAGALLVDQPWRQVLLDADADGALRPGISPAVGRMLVLGALNWAPEWWHPDIPVDDVARAAHRLATAGLFHEGAIR